VVVIIGLICILESGLITSAYSHSGVRIKPVFKVKISASDVTWSYISHLITDISSNSMSWHGLVNTLRYFLLNTFPIATLTLRSHVSVP